MEYGDFAWQLENALSQIFGIPMEWFLFPNIVFYFIIPLIVLIVMWYIFLEKKLRIFRRSAPNFGLSLVLGFFSTPLIALATPLFVTPIAIGITILVMGRFSFWRIIISIVVTAAIWLIYPVLISFVIT
jgi:hypothetical protein